MTAPNRCSGGATASRMAVNRFRPRARQHQSGTTAFRNCYSIIGLLMKLIRGRFFALGRHAYADAAACGCWRWWATGSAVCGRGAPGPKRETPRDPPRRGKKILAPRLQRGVTPCAQAQAPAGRKNVWPVKGTEGGPAIPAAGAACGILRRATHKTRAFVPNQFDAQD